MSRSATVAVVAAVLGVTFLPSAAYAQEVTAGNCATTYAAATETNVLVNGPVHSYYGTITVGDFTPSTFINGETAATTAFVVCTV